MDKAKSSFNTEKGVLKGWGGRGQFEDKCCVVTHCAADIRVAWLVYACTYCVPIATLNQNERTRLLYENEVHALARLAFYENLLVGQESSVCCPH